MADTQDDELLLSDELPDDDADDDILDIDEDGSDNEDAPEVVMFGDDAPEDEAPETKSGLVAHLRRELRERNRRLEEIERSRTAPDAGPKPTLESCDYDPDVFERELDKWKEADAATKRAGDAQTEADKRLKERWTQQVATYQAGKAALPYADKDEAEERVTDELTTAQQATLVKAAKDPARMMYALGKHPTRLQALAKIEDLIELAGEVARLETTMKTTKRNAPPPERIPNGSAPVSSGDREQTRLEREAEKTGNRTALIAYKKSKRKP